MSSFTQQRGLWIVNESPLGVLVSVCAGEAGVWGWILMSRLCQCSYLSLGLGVLRMLSVSSSSGPLSLGLYISRLSYSSSRSSSTSWICSLDTCSRPKPTWERRTEERVTNTHGRCAALTPRVSVYHLNLSLLFTQTEAIKITSTAASLPLNER